MGNLAAIVVGNGFVKTYREGTSVIYPSIVGEDQGGLDFDGLSTSKDRVIDFEGKRYAIGETAWRLSIVQQTQMDRSRIGKPFYRTLFASALAATFAQSGEVSVVITLPVAWYRKRDEVRNQLAGIYKVGVGKKQLTFDLPPENLRIVPEGFGVLAAQLLDAEGTVKRSNLSKSMVGIVEVGTGTTDFSLFNGLELVPVKSDGIDKGLRIVWDAVSGDIERAYGRRLEPHEIDRAILKGAFKDSGAVRDVTIFTKSRMPMLSTAIQSWIDGTWDSGRIADVIFFGGGGAPQVKSYFHYPHQEFVDDGYIQDALGSFRFGLFKSKRG